MVRVLETAMESELRGQACSQWCWDGTRHLGGVVTEAAMEWEQGGKARRQWARDGMRHWSGKSNGDSNGETAGMGTHGGSGPGMEWELRWA